MTSPITDVSYAQFAQLPHILNKDNSTEDLRRAAQHFESMFIDMWLKAARQANESLASDNFMNTNEMKMHQQMLDHEMSIHMAKNGGIGLADTIVRQLNGQAPIIDQATHTQAAVAPKAKRTAMFSTPQDFVDELRPIIQRALRDTSLPLDGVLSQAALETGWGNNVITAGDGNTTHNLFGIKAKGAEEPSVAISSMEFELGRWVNKIANFRSYPDWEASVQDYVETLKNDPRYSEALTAGSDVVSFAKGLVSGGYATDPKYADKLITLSQRIGMM